jgi:hypothetical protein
MQLNFMTWIGQVTTAHGAMILGPTLLAIASGSMTWPTALPLLVAGVIGLLWPENIGLKTAAQNAATDLETLIAAYRTGLTQGAAAATPAPGSTPASTAGSVPAVGTTAAAASAAAANTPAVTTAAAATQPAAVTTAAAVAAMLLAGLALTACASQTPAQQAATETAVASGLLCVADASGAVVATAMTNDPDAVKAISAAAAAGNTLLTDAACRQALAAGVAAAPAATSAPTVATPAPVAATPAPSVATPALSASGTAAVPASGMTGY